MTNRRRTPAKFIYLLPGTMTFLFGMSAQSSYQCSSLFTNSHTLMYAYAATAAHRIAINQLLAVQKNTNSIMSYLAPLVQIQVVRPSDLATFLEALKQQKLINPVPHTHSDLGLLFKDITHQIYFEGFNDLIMRAQESSVSVDFARLIAWVESHVKISENVREERQSAEKETKQTIRKAIFNRIEPGSLLMGGHHDDIEQVEVTISLAFEMMSTPVTQWMWFVIMKRNPSEHVSGIEEKTVARKGKTIKLLPNNPVDSVTWKDTQIFIKKINALSLEGNPIVNTIIPDHKPGDVYRLPTEAEWYFVATNRGRNYGKWYFGDNEDELQNHAWLF